MIWGGAPSQAVIAATAAATQSGGTTILPPSAAWVWAGQGPTLTFGIAASQRAWVWAPAGAVLSFAVAAAQAAWIWAAGAASFTGGNFASTFIRFVGPVWKRRRTRVQT